MAAPSSAPRPSTPQPATPTEIVAELDARAKTVATPCGSGRMVWRCWGEGTPLVLLHGGYGSWTHWIRNIDALAARHRVIAPDLPGLGQSDMPPEPGTPEAVAAIVGDGLRRVLGATEGCDLAGFSFGAIIAGHVAAGFGPRARSLTLVGAAGLGIAPPHPIPIEPWQDATTPAAEREIHRRNLAALMIADPAEIDELALHLQAQNHARVRFRSRPISLTDGLRRMLPRVAGRLNGIWGGRDVLASTQLERYAATLHGARPDATFTVIEAAGHWVQYEAHEAFTSLLARLIRLS